MQRLAISAGPAAVQRLVNRPQVRQTQPSALPTPEFRPMVQLQAMPSAQPPVIQRRLLALAEFKRRKDAATTTKSFGRTRSIGDVKKHYDNYAGFVREKKYDKATEELGKLRDKIERMRAKTYWKPEGEKDALLRDMIQGIDTEVQWLEHEISLNTRGDQTLGRAQSGVKPVSDRVTATLMMGQGLIVNLGQMILTSSAFSTCSPIVMFNSATNMGALFHLPALGRDRMEENLTSQSGRLKSMYNRVRPTEIHLNHRGKKQTDDSGMALFQDAEEGTSDVEPMKRFFSHECSYTGPYRIIEGEADQYSVTLGEHNTVSVVAGSIHAPRGGTGLSVADDSPGARRSAIEDAWRDAPLTVKVGYDEN